VPPRRDYDYVGIALALAIVAMFVLKRKYPERTNGRKDEAPERQTDRGF